ncbi:MAG: OmpA/MotB family protein, partial [Bacteroidota bacterium]
FEIGSSNLKPEARNILIRLASEIGKLSNYVEVEGHTDSRSFGSGSGYTNWELSADRANSARRILEKNGMWEGQIKKVTGYSDNKLRNPDNPFDISNRRISILIKQLTANQFLETVNTE